jgi:hypothetical protein
MVSSAIKGGAAVEMPIESPRKYGVFDDDADAFARVLGGKPTAARLNVSAREATPGGEEPITEDDLRGMFRDSQDKYGK